MIPARPSGMAEVVATFGDPLPFVNGKEVWEASALVTALLPTSLIYAYDTTRLVTRVRAHHLIAEHLSETLMECLAAGVPLDRIKYGGAYCWRAKRTSAELSLHTWGIAVDLEPAENPLGKPWQPDGKMLDARIVSVFKDRGWFWGGEFSRPDSMHFQWASGV